MRNTTLRQGGTGGVTLQTIHGVAVATFSAFSNKLEVGSYLGTTATSFEFVSKFTLGSASDGIKPLTETLLLKVSSYIVSVPAGSFHKNSYGQYVYGGTINGVRLGVKITPSTTTANTYTLEAEGNGVALTVTKPVRVGLEIGNDIGFGTATLD